MSTSSRIFISYRRDDSSGYAGRLNEQLRGHFGHHQVFMDIDTIEPGIDFHEYISGAIGAVDVMVVLIGRQWLATTGPGGARRIDEPDDLVRMEIAGALERKLRVIPVLVEGATMPEVPDLPPPLVPLARRNAIEMSDSRWDYDLQRLVGVIQRALDAHGTTPAAEAAPAIRAESASATSAVTQARRPAKLRRSWGRPGPALHLQPSTTAVIAIAAFAVLVWGTLLPRQWHSESGGLRMASASVLVILVAAGLWRSQLTWVAAGGFVGLVGTVVWVQVLVSGGHTVGDLFSSGDGASNVLQVLGSVVVLGTGLVALRLERGSGQPAARSNSPGGSA